ncbi:putative LPS assembly protein LptD [Pseudopedobacter beijingensis]|uniref:LPS assembly protein LptD n=1 Tax=Pseudopedobacter beijingensis TaxID=1207056 RepID=A0ABW4IIQ3_9SPHI
MAQKSDSIAKVRNPIVSSDSLAIDSTQLIKKDTTQKKPNKSEITDKIVATAEDSSFIDNKRNIGHYYGKARVVYGDKTIDANYIRVNFNDKTIFAKGTRDSLGMFSGPVIFKDPSQGALTADSVYYNFKTSKGKIYQVYTEQEGGYITGGKIKKQEDNEMHMKGVVYSTCSNPYPHQHFGIVITKGIAEEKRIITGPAYIVIEDVPLPIVLPFGFFPKPNKRASGILFPQFGEDATLGFYLRDFGYYLGLSDYWDMTLRGGIYSKGSYQADVASRYMKRYKYTGNLSFSFASRKYGVEGTPEYEHPQRDFNLRWSHSQNPNARPGTVFSASVNAGTSSYYKNNGNGLYDFNQISQNNLNSSISYSKTWANSPFNLSAGLTHNQDLSRRTVNLGFPSLSFGMSTLNPFDKKDRVGEQKWYQRIAVGYSLMADNRINTTDSMLFKKETMNKIQSGIKHNIPISLSSKVMKYFQFSQSINYTENWYFQTIRKRYALAPTPTGTKDSTSIDTVQGFRRAGEYSVGGSLSTKIYGMVNFKKGKVMAVRHVLTPNIGFSYRPDFSKPKYGYYEEMVVNEAGDIRKYSIFEQSMYGGPSGGRSAAINFGLDNNIEMKVRSSKDTTGNGVKKIPILQGLSLNGSYNFVADSFKLSLLNFSGRTFFTEKLGVNFGGTLDPYVYEKRIRNGVVEARKIDKYQWESGKLPRLASFNFSFDYSLNSSTVGKNNKNNNPPNPGGNNNLFERLDASELAQIQQISRDANSFVDFTIPWNFSFYYNFTYSNTVVRNTISQTLSANGDFSLTPKWKVQFTSGYDFERKQISATSFSIYRDLHCWDLSINWSPFGSYKYYGINLRVKSSILQDLKLSKRSGYQSFY